MAKLAFSVEQLCRIKANGQIVLQVNQPTMKAFDERKVDFLAVVEVDNSTRRQHSIHHRLSQLGLRNLNFEKDPDASDISYLSSNDSVFDVSAVVLARASSNSKPQASNSSGPRASDGINSLAPFKLDSQPFSPARSPTNLMPSIPVPQLPIPSIAEVLESATSQTINPPARSFSALGIVEGPAANSVGPAAFDSIASQYIYSNSLISSSAISRFPNIGPGGAGDEIGHEQSAEDEDTPRGDVDRVSTGNEQQEASGGGI